MWMSVRRGLPLGVIGSALLVAGLPGCRASPVLPLVQSAPGWEAGDYAFTLEAGGLTRRYVVHVPPGYDGSRQAPAVIVLHGAGGSGDRVLRWTGWSDQADRIGFLAVGPDGTRAEAGAGDSPDDAVRAWSDGSGRGYPADLNVDDVGFIGRLIDEVEARFSVDQRRVYAVGFSNGAAMAYRLGVELSDRLAAVAPVAGQLWVPASEISSPIALFAVVGEDDPLNPPDGGQVISPWVGPEWKPAFRDSVERWAALLGCRPEARQAAELGEVRVVRYAACWGGSEVVWYTIGGLGHTWPDRPVPAPTIAAGGAAEWVNATEAVWRFFERHPRS